jgi:DNA-binding transcriptional ArsR family regulator
MIEVMQPNGCLFEELTPQVDEVFRALADPSRRALLDSLNRRNGQSLRELCAGLDMARQSVSKHLAILEEANLVTTVWRGREKLHYLNAAPISDIAERWINRYDRAAAYEIGDEQRARFAAEPRSKVTFDLEPIGDMVKLTVVHDGFDQGSQVLAGISQGWPLVLAGLKSLLETGETLPVG